MQSQQLLNDAMSMLQRRQFRESLPLFDKLIKLGVNDYRLYRAKGSAQQHLHMLKESQDSFMKSLKLNPHQPDLLVAIARCFMMQGDTDKAESYFNMTIALNPDDIDAQIGLAKIYEEKGFLTKAISNHEKVISDKFNFKSFAILIDLYLKVGLYDKAQAIISRFEGELSEDWRFDVEKAWLFKRTGKLDKAIEIFKSILHKRKDGSNRFEDLILCLIESGRRDEALNLLDSSLVAYPDSSRLLSWQANLLYEKGRVDFLDSYKSRVAERGEFDNISTYVNYLLMAKRFDEANEMLAFNENKLDVRSLKISLALAEGDFEKAARLSENLLDINATEQKLSLLTRVCLAIGDYRSAKGYIEALIKRSPYNQYYLGLLAAVLKVTDEDAYSKLCNFDLHVTELELEVPVGYRSLNSFNTELEEVLLGLHVSQNNPLEQSLYCGTQTAGHLFETRNTLLKKLQAALRGTITSFLKGKRLDPEDPVLSRMMSDFRFATAWSVKLNSSGFHHSHVHTKGWYSSAYYVSVPFEAGNQGQLILGKPGVELPARLDADRTITPENGKLVLFPSYYWHGTTPFRSHQHRMTVAFDLVPFE